MPESIILAHNTFLSGRFINHWLFLFYRDLSYNDFTGDLPSSFASLSNINRLWVFPIWLFLLLDASIHTNS